ncbi:hypothetical protein RB195_010735 [Necator americanus]|uniref:Uncharacterized protein n=1 Tax=Necator americanus TaxID=51031 RepID=A0ABR1D0I3_NECAM
MHHASLTSKINVAQSGYWWLQTGRARFRSSSGYLLSSPIIFSGNCNGGNTHLFATQRRYKKNKKKRSSSVCDSALVFS